MSPSRQQIKSLKKIVSLYYAEEERHYEENEQPENHVFFDFKVIKSMIEDYCCNENTLVWKEEGEVWPWEVWRCVDCNKEYNVELIRDFKNKEDR